MSNIPEAYPIVNEDTWVKQHRTMAVIMIDGDPNYNYKERANRFAASINRADTVKADIFALSDGNLYYAGDEYNSPEHDAKIVMTGSKPGGRSYESLKEFAKSKGYTQICFLESCI